MQQAASSKVNHLGTLPGDCGAAGSPSSNKRKATEVGGITGFTACKLSLPKKKVPLPCLPALAFMRAGSEKALARMQTRQRLNTTAEYGEHSLSLDSVRYRSGHRVVSECF